MLTARAFWIARRRAGFDSGFAPPDFTAIAMSFATRVNAFAIRSQRANIVALRVSKMRPTVDLRGVGLSPAIGSGCRREVPSAQRNTLLALERQPHVLQ